ncbi:MAG: alanine--tRNA ligase [Chlorobi bacterium]|nr:alanine--tRNA ligase [Chlorobiota bacterium]
MPTAKEIRQKFLDFFEKKGHKIVPSAPIVLKDDPTLMFTNAGMNQFKEYFLGYKEPPYKRVADTQKCLRVSGKHNDLEEVGKDTYHHTMFEMLGNWSFGDYFKKEAIDWAWELLVKEYGMDPDRLYATVFEGDPSENLEADEEARKHWQKHLPDDRILYGNKKDNFWEMGATGPCGPSSEIHIDLRSNEERAKIPGSELVNKDHPEVIEIWNLVFIQNNRKEDGSLEKLPQRHVDTGMGLERLVRVLQGKKSNYDTDLFQPIIKELEIITGKKYGEDEATDVAFRVVADHLRAVSFAIADGQLPSNTGAGYVIRRILRRAIRYGYQFLGMDKPFIHMLVPVLSEMMGDVFPELRSQERLIMSVIKEEEQSFLRTLEQGLYLLKQMLAQSQDKVLPGAKAFELYDTYGFPPDLTALIASEEGYRVDMKGFEEEMAKQKARSKAATKQETGDWIVLREDDKEEFIGYDYTEADVKITKYRKVKTPKGEVYQLVFNLTPFYPEGGGQVGDRGVLLGADGEPVHIFDTKKENDLIIHLTKNLPRNLHQTFRAKVDKKARANAAAHHSATHLLHQALRHILGEHVQQKGSYVGPDKLRFDFSHFSKLTDEELKQVEDFVNTKIAKQLPLEEKRNMPYKEAVEKEGAMAFFGEKYGDTVRVIRFGDHAELCGGTHVDNTKDIWHFKILSESSVASGIRRIEAITADALKDYYQQADRQLQEVKKRLKNPPDVVNAVEHLTEEVRQLRKENEALRKDKAQMLLQNMKDEAKQIGPARFVARKTDLDQASIKELLFRNFGQTEDMVVLLATEDKEKGKAGLTLFISKPLTEKYGLDAGQIVREAAKLIHGGGGGQKFFATAGGKNPGGIPKALERAEKILKEKLS